MLPNTNTPCLCLCRTKQLYIFVLGNLKHQYQYFCRFCMPKITLQDICKQNIQLVWESITESNFIGQTFVQTLIFSLGSALTPSHSLKYRLAEINRVPWILHRYFHGNLLQHLSYPYIDNFWKAAMSPILIVQVLFWINMTSFWTQLQPTACRSSGEGDFTSSFPLILFNCTSHVLLKGASAGFTRKEALPLRQKEW